MNNQTLTREQYDAAIAQASQAGAEIARRRFDEIMALEGASNFPGLARKIALEMDMPASEAAAIFAAAMRDRNKLPAGQAPQRERPDAERQARQLVELARQKEFVRHRASMAAEPTARGGQGRDQVKDGWSRAVAKANAAYGLT